MEFKEISGSILTEKEKEEINDLVRKGNLLIDKLKGECTFELFKKLVINYANLINKKKEFIEGLIERTLGPEPETSVRINEIISKTNDLINSVKKASVINNYANNIIKKLEELLAKYKVFVNFSFSIKYSLQQPVVKKHKIILNINELSIARLVQLIIYNHSEEMKKFLFTDEDLIESKALESFLEGINKENLLLCIRKDEAHSDFLLKAYVMLSNEKKKIKSLINTMKTHIISPDESSLDMNISFVKKELKKTASELVKALDVIKKARMIGIKTEHLVSVYNEDLILEKGEDVIKAYMRLKYPIDDLPEQFLFEFLTTYDIIPEWLEDYEDISKQSPYLFLKRFFS